MNKKKSIICCIIILFSLVLTLIAILIPTINEATENGKTKEYESNTNYQIANESNIEMVNSSIQEEVDSVYISEEESKELSKSIDENGIVMNTVMTELNSDILDN